MKKGFSLIELVLAIGLFAMVMVSANLLMFATLRGSRKAEAIGVVKSEGAYALSAMTTRVRYATITGCTGAALTIQEISNNPVTYTYGGNRLYYTDPLEGAGNKYLTSTRVKVTDCGGGVVFTCSPDLRLAEICFSVDSATGSDVTDKTGSGSNGIQFKTQVTLRNFE